MKETNEEKATRLANDVSWLTVEERELYKRSILSAIEWGEKIDRENGITNNDEDMKVKIEITKYDLLGAASKSNICKKDLRRMERDIDEIEDFELVDGCVNYDKIKRAISEVIVEELISSNGYKRL